MKQHIEHLLYTALKKLESLRELPAIPAFVEVEATKDKQHGDFASNIAMVLAKLAEKRPQEIAERIVQLLPKSSHIQKIEIAGPGFINFFLTLQSLNDVVAKILTEKETYGRCKIGRGKRILVEFLSSNPTGPLHVGHGRHAAFGIAVSNLLDAVGFKTYREYYINDVGKQMDILTVSVWLRYLVFCGEEIEFPTNAYCGDYVINIAGAIYEQYGLHFHVFAKHIFDQITHTDHYDEQYINAIIECAKTYLADKYQTLYNLGLEYILADIREDLKEFGICFDNWVSERQFVAIDLVEKTLADLKQNGHTYQKDGAIWLRTTDFGDEKDRVLIRSNGQETYFANDVAYHLTKFDRGFDIAIDIFGADHHGYATRMKSAMKASRIDPERLIHLLVQFVTLYRGGEQLQMSTRDGHFVTLRELRKEVGNDAARFFYVMRRNEQYMEFDLDLALAQSNENPVYYVQYAYARICGIFKQLEERGLYVDETQGLGHLHRLTETRERQLLNTLSLYPDMIVHAALNYEPHQLTNYLRDLASDFHTYYTLHQFLVDEMELRNARLALIAATRQILLNGLNLLGINAPKSMCDHEKGLRKKEKFNKK